jgi:hypothetical protein
MLLLSRAAKSLKQRESHHSNVIAFYIPYEYHFVFMVVITV